MFSFLVNVCILLLALIVLCINFLLLLEQFTPVSGGFLSGCRGWFKLWFEVAGSYGVDFSSSAGTVLVAQLLRRWINVIGKESASGLY